ncbi:unnamed protein product [Symbiodinium natans]|uniref:LamG-like jellyroll fold domain-containing protein n=1 Tax=Symbiodinium natans TaxID=878477 RepID=A0A812NEB6_9DINO|nr:unnamed protein product [Symbiodinium natans]
MDGPLRFANASSSVSMPTSGPLQLIDYRWDGRFKSSGSFLALAAPFTIWVVRMMMHEGEPTIDLQMWLDLRAAACEQGRALSLAWLRAPDAKSTGVLLFSTPFAVCACNTKMPTRPQVVASYDRPQLIASALPDRLVSVELQTGVSLFAGSVAGGAPLGGRFQSTTRLRARVRTRPVSCCEVLGTLLQDSSWMNETDWRLTPAELPKEVDDKQLWPAAACAEAPPQLKDVAGTVLRLATAAHDEFRALAAILCGLSSRRGSGGDVAPARVAAQIEDTLHRLWSGPARSPMVATAGSCLMTCSVLVGGARAEALALAGNGLVKQDLLPLGILLPAVVRHASEAKPSYLGLTLLSRDTAWPMAVQATPGEFHWCDAFQSRAPLVEALVEKAVILQSTKPTRSSGLPDCSASAILEQPFSEAPPLRKASQACPLHTATVLQWLGLGSTQVQVRSFKAIQQEAEESPSSREESPGRGDREPVMLPSGLLVYWRCADGEGNVLRDSGGCGRAGALRGGSWQGPLSPDDPMEPTDEWGQMLLPNFAVQLCNAELSYSGSSASDRKQLALVGGERAGTDLQVPADSDGIDAMPGWTVELWMRSTPSSPKEDLQIVRRAHSGQYWSLCYRPSRPGFVMVASGQTSPILEGACEPLPSGEWIHFALRSDLNSLEVCLDGRMVVSSAISLPSAPLEANISFGPAELDITEVRIWGVCRSDNDLLHFHRQCLDTVLSGELRGEAWKKVKIRAATGATGATHQGETSGLWGITDMPKQGGRSRKAEAEDEQVQNSWPTGFEGGSRSQDLWPQLPFADASGFDAPWPAPARGAKTPDTQEATSCATSSWQLAQKETQGFASPQLPAAQPAASLTVPWSQAAPPSVAYKPTPPPPEDSAHRTREIPATTPPVGRLMQGILERKRAEEAKRKTVTEDASPAPSAVPEQGSKQSSVRSPDLAPSRGQAPARGPRSSPLPPSPPPEPARAQAPALMQVLPPWPGKAVPAADASLNAAVAALERQEYSFAVAAFKSCIPQLLKSGIMASAPAVRPRVQAAVNYMNVCQLLQHIQEKQEAVTKAPGDALVKHELCQSWECVLRLAKAPRHTIRFIIHAMASLFHFARGAGGWAAAHHLAQVLLHHHDAFLDGAERKQVMHVLTTTRHGRLSGCLGTEMTNACPVCRAPADFLAPACDSCHAVFGVDFQKLTICDVRKATTCTVCKATFGQGDSVPVQNERRRQAGLTQPIKSTLCPACAVGELYKIHSTASF